MKGRVLVFILGVLLISSNLYAADGDLILLTARHLRFQPGMSAGRAAQSTRRDGLPFTIC